MGMDTEINVEERMAVYEKISTVGAPHQLLAKMAGSWKTRTKAWMLPDQPPVESEGTSENKMILGGRFLHQEFKGDMMGAPFTGIGVNGFDNHTQKFVSTWVDSMATGIYYFEGSADADGRQITQESNYDDPFKGPITWRSVIKIIDDDTHEFEMYSIDQNGTVEKMMEITYTRSR